MAVNWDQGNENISALCTAWRQAFRRVWKLPYNYHIKIIVDFCLIVCRYLIFCVNDRIYLSEIVLNNLVKFVSHNAAFYDRIRSSMGRNVQLCCECFNAF